MKVAIAIAITAAVWIAVFWFAANKKHNYITSYQFKIPGNGLTNEIQGFGHFESVGEKYTIADKDYIVSQIKKTGLSNDSASIVILNIIKLDDR